MAIQSGVGKKLVYKAETTWGTLAGTTGGQRLRRTSSDVALQKDTYQSNEIRSDFQVADMRHGTRRIAGTISGELSLATYKDFLAAQFRAAWATGVSKSNTEFTSMAADNATSKFTVGGSTWVAQGFKVGDVIRFANLSEAANNSKNFLITALSGVDATVYPTPTTMSADTSFTVAVQGKKLVMAESSHTNDSFTIEHNYADIDVSEVFSGCRITSTRLSLPGTGLMTASFGVVGKDMEVKTAGNAPYFTSPTAETSTGILAAVNGRLYIGGTAVAVVTGMELTIDNNISGDPVIGANTVPELFQGRMRVSGQVTAFFENETLLNLFVNETEFQIIAFIEAAGSDPKEFMVINLPRCKSGGAAKDDGEKGLIQNIPFTALIQTSGGASTVYDKTTIALQDSLVS